MALVRTFRLPHYEAHPVYVAVFKNVTNAAFLRSQLLEANPDFDYAFLDASTIISQTHLLAATLSALHLSLTQRSKTRTPHSELVFRLSPNNNIGESYKNFGIADTTTTVIAVKLALSPDVTADSVSNHLGDAVQGESVQIGELGDELGDWCDVDRVKKVYKLGDDKKKGKGAKGVVVNGEESGNDKKVLESVILGTIAMKGS